MRLFFAIITGYLIFAVSAGLLYQFLHQDPHGVTGALLVMLCAVSGGFMASRYARNDGLIAGLWVGSLIALGAVVAMVLEGPAAWPALLLTAPSAVAGGWLSQRTRHSDTSATDPGPASSQ